MSREIHCTKLGRSAEALERAPWPGELGQRILREISKPAWQEWLRQQTILINDYKLSPLDPKHKRYLAEQMEAYLFGDGIVLPDEWRPPEDA